MGGSAAIAQQDIKSFYDSLPILDIAVYLIEAGMPIAEVACLIRHQLCPKIIVRCSIEAKPVGHRTIGGITGSRVAGMLGRIPVEDILARRHQGWFQYGFRTTERVLMACSWVDNIYSAGSSAWSAIQILEDIEDQLCDNWHLEIITSSRSCMVAEGGDAQSPHPEKWPVTTTFDCLGHTLQHDGGIRACVNNAKKSCWRAFWSNFSSKGSRQLSMRDKDKIVDRAVAAIFRYKCSRWPAQESYAKEMDKLQNKMVAILMRVPRYPGELSHECVRRRNHTASCHARTTKRWSQIWYSRVLSWHEHLKRPANKHSWAAQTLLFRGEAFLQEQRVSHNSGSALAGRTGTRSKRGVVHMRWHDGIKVAFRRCD